MSLELWLGMLCCFIALTILFAFLGHRHLQRCTTEDDLERNAYYLFLFDLYGIGAIFTMFVSSFTLRIG